MVTAAFFNNSCSGSSKNNGRNLAEDNATSHVLHDITSVF